MGIRGKLEAELDIKSNGDLFHALFGSKLQEVSNISPEKIHIGHLREGQCGKTGSIICGHCTLERLSVTSGFVSSATSPCRKSPPVSCVWSAPRRRLSGARRAEVLAESACHLGIRNSVWAGNSGGESLIRALCAEAIYRSLSGGQKCASKETVELDEENKSIRFKIIGGDFLDDYKSLSASCHVISMGEVTSVKWIFEFEKMHDDGPYPTKELDFLIAVTKDLEAHDLKA